MGKEVLKTKIEEAKEETGEDPIVIITKPGGFKEDTPLRQQLEVDAQGGRLESEGC